MAITFAVRGDSFTARYAPGQATAIARRGGSAAGTVPVIAATTTTGLIGGSMIDLDRNVAASNSRYVSWPALGNISTARTRSVLVRCAFGEAGISQGIFRIGGPNNENMQFAFWLNAGVIRVRLFSEYATQYLNATGVFNPTLGQYYDIVLTWDGTNGANSAILYIDGAAVITATPTGSWPTPIDTTIIDSILVGAHLTVPLARLRLNELVVWDTVIDPTNVALTSGNGSLNGSTRTAFVDVSVLDGSQFSNPGAANVMSGTSYVFAGVTYSGSVHNATYTDPGIANVLSGTSYIFNDATLTGTFSAPTYTDPGVGNVLSGTSYIFNDVTQTGTYHNYTNTTPAVGDVKVGTTWIYNDNTQTGTWNYPEASLGQAGTVDLNAILEQIRYLLEQANTTTAANDLSSNMTRRVNKILKVNPVQIPLQASFYPFVTCHVVSKNIETQDISRNSTSAKRKAVVEVDVVGAVWNPNFQQDSEDPAAEDINYLMENVELVIRSSVNLGSKVTWQLADSTSYDGARIDEQTHLRAGVLSLKGTVFY